jgi:hypothetical protein
MDVHVPQPITDQLRLRGVDVLTAVEDGCRTLEDDELLEHARTLGRALFTRDKGFKALAESWQRQGRPFAGLLFGHRRGTIGHFVTDLELIARTTDPVDWVNKVEHLPY